MGQETISRVHHMGHVNKVLVRLKLEGEEGDELPPSGAEVLSSTVVGKLTSRAWSPTLNGVAALATVRLEESKPGTALWVASGRLRRSAQVL